MLLKRSAAILVVIIFAGSLISIQSQTTAFNYQGSLKAGGSPANGNFDFQFLLFDASSDGTQLGSTVSVNNIAVSNGIFSIQLDFGDQFPGAVRFLEIRVQTSGGGGFTTLSPRQPLTSTPYSVKSLNSDAAANAANAIQLGGVAASQYLQTNGNGSGLTNLDAGNIATGTLSNARLGQLPTANIADLAVTDAKIGGMASSKLSGVVPIANGGTGLTTIGSTGSYLRANGGAWTNSTIQPGDLPDLGNLYIKNSANVVQNLANLNISGTATAGNINATGAFYLNSNRILFAPLVKNTYLGRNLGIFNSSGDGNTFLGFETGFNNTSGSANTLGGLNAGKDNTTGSNNTIVGGDANVGAGDLTFASAFGSQAVVSQSNSLVLGRSGTNVGIGISNPVTRLHVVAGSPKTTVATTRAFSVSTNDAYTSPGNPANPFTLDIRLVGAATLANRAAFFQTTELDTADGGNILLQPQAGRVGIGTTAPTETLSVNGTASKTGGGSWAVFSDERLKTIGKNFTPGLKAVMRLQPLHFAYKPGNALGLKSDGDHVGFSAQALQRVLPEAVTTNESGYLMVNNDPVIWALLNAVKEQQAQIQRQEEQINALRSLVCARNRNAASCKVKK